jgi:DNA-binding response OmpR family regulator
MTPKSTKPPVPGDEQSAAPESPAKKGKVILIVEDERPLSHALEMKLRSQGYETQVCSNGGDALEAMAKGGCKLVLLDLIMPVMDGFGVLEEMQKRKLKIPVIILSNLGQEEDRNKAKTLGAIDYFVKSNTPIAEIVNRVKSVL